MILEMFIGLMIFAFLCELIDSTLGMGYGTTLTPILLLFGFPPLLIVPSVLFTEFITGILSGLLHHKAKNVHFGKKSLDTKVMAILSICSVIGTIIAVYIANYIPTFYLKLYIGILVLSMGIAVFITRNKTFKFSWKKIIGLGTVASFNKGMSGGGYGPLVTSGQILSGVKDKSAIGITSISEGITSGVGFTMFILIGTNIDFSFILPLFIGAILSVPLSVLFVKKISSFILKRSISLLTVVLGLVTIIKLVI